MRALESWQVGDTFGPQQAGRVTRTRLALFAGASGDHNEVHLDVDVARAAGMSDVFAQGMLSMAFLGRLLTDNFGPESVAAFRARFTALTPVDAEPVCTGQVVAVSDGIATVDLVVELEDGNRTLVGSAKVRLTGQLS